jgi:hypothetical protein
MNTDDLPKSSIQAYVMREGDTRTERMPCLNRGTAERMAAFLNTLTPGQPFQVLPAHPEFKEVAYAAR